jgi:hypothetical protein
MRRDSDGIYEAIFDVGFDLDSGTDADLFGSDADDDHVGLHSWTSRLAGDVPTIRTPIRNREAGTDGWLPRNGGISEPTSPGSRSRSARRNGPKSPLLSAADGPTNPFSRLFGGRRESEASERLNDGLRRVHEMLEGTKELPVNSLKAEMKELQERQARIEGLLLTLTRGMRKDVGGSGSSRS